MTTRSELSDMLIDAASELRAIDMPSLADAVDEARAELNLAPKKVETRDRQLSFPVPGLA